MPAPTSSSFGVGVSAFTAPGEEIEYSRMKRSVPVRRDLRPRRGGQVRNPDCVALSIFGEEDDGEIQEAFMFLLRGRGQEVSDNPEREAGMTSNPNALRAS